MSLILILALPFAGSLCAALLPSNARNAEAWLAGLIALACAVLVASLYPQVAGGGVVPTTSPGRRRWGCNSRCAWTATPGCSR